MSTLLVTGGAGFIGSALVRHLIENTEHHVVNVDALTYAGNLGSLAPIWNEARHMFERLEPSQNCLSRIMMQASWTKARKLAA